METARLIIDPPGDGVWNMAVDHALLETANESGQMSVRFYQWAKPTLSLGYFQKIADRNLHLASDQCTTVRRSTGGGAILHDHEITYSISIPSENRWSREHERLYFMMHEIVLELLGDLGIKGELFEGTPTAGRDQAFLCFQRRAIGDVIVNGSKVGGSAQRRKRNALLQHGSLLLRKSENAPEISGIEEVTDLESINRNELLQSWIQKLARKSGVELEQKTLSEFEVQAVDRACKDIYGNLCWTDRR